MKLARTMAARLVASGMLLLPFAPLAAESKDDLKRQVEDLTQRVEALERRLAPNAAAAVTPPPAPKATPSAPAQGPSQAEAIGFYHDVDRLVVDGKLDEARKLMTAFETKYAGTPGAGYSQSLAREVAVVGRPAPTDWSIEKWFQGQSDIQLDGDKPTLLVFWEVWCPHCKSEAPRFEQVWQTGRDKGLQVLGVTRITQTATEEGVREFVGASKITYPMAKETGALAEYFAVSAIPAAAVVKGGKIVWRGHPARLTDELLQTWR